MSNTISGMYQSVIAQSHMPTNWRDGYGTHNAYYTEQDGMRVTDVANMPGPGTIDVSAKAIEPVDMSQRVFDESGGLKYIHCKGQTINVRC
jgi:hypothetical protein